MARIRTIKPAFFRHGALFDAEKASGLPLRIAFAGLWTAADREGRFKWQPRELKLDCLPYDDVDFSRVLDALVTGGWLVRYEVDGVKYGAIPSWKDHQVINNREMASDIPEPNENNTLTREARVVDAPPTPLVQVTGEYGREGEREGKELSSASPPASSRFDEFWKEYPKRDGDNPRKPAEKKFNALVKTGVDPEFIIAGARKASAEARRQSSYGTKFVPQAIKWLNDQRFHDYAAQSILIEPEQLDWEAVLTTFKRNGYWSRYAGNDPSSPACRAPPELLAKYGLGFQPKKDEDAA
jgi:hypothetical protein